MAALLIGYARCSTDQQGLTAQRDALTALGVAPARLYVDHGLTGTNVCQRYRTSHFVSQFRPFHHLLVGEQKTPDAALLPMQWIKCRAEREATSGRRSPRRPR